MGEEGLSSDAKDATKTRENVIEPQGGGANGWRALCTERDERLAELLRIWNRASDRQRDAILVMAADQVR